MSLECLVRVIYHAPHDGRELLTLLGLANNANPSGVCWTGHARLQLYARIQSKRNLQQYLARLAERGSIYRKEGSGRERTLYLIVPGLTAEQIIDALTDPHYFALADDEAEAIAADLLNKQRQARDAFAFPLDDLQTPARRPGARSRHRSPAVHTIQDTEAAAAVITRSPPTAPTASPAGVITQSPPSAPMTASPSMTTASPAEVIGGSPAGVIEGSPAEVIGGSSGGDPPIIQGRSGDHQGVIEGSSRGDPSIM